MRSRKITKRVERQSGLRKTRFFEKTTNVFICFFFKETGFCSFLKKKQKSILNCFHCIVQHHQFHNYTIITCYSLRIMAFKFEGKEMYPIFVFAKCCWSMVRLGMNVHTEKSHSHTNSAVSRQVYVHRRFVHVAVGLWKVPQQGHFIFIIFINFTIGSVPITWGDDHLVQNLLLVCSTYCSWHITQVAT